MTTKNISAFKINTKKYFVIYQKYLLFIAFFVYLGIIKKLKREAEQWILLIIKF